jgi:predicted membrane channel-forming protein YqfA (hemolysin III family)
MEDRDAERGLLGSGQEPRQQTIPREIDNHLAGLEASTPCTIAPFGIPLYTYREIPPFLKGNPYITDGYRAHLSPELCAKSTFIWSNETINIWSHLLGLVYFAMLLMDDVFGLLPQNNAQFGDYFIFTILSLCFQICMLCSAGYHMFMCQSELASRRWLGLDLAGVSLGFCGCYFPGSYYAFYCDKSWQMFYMTMMCFLAICSIVAQAHSKFMSEHCHFRRVMLYALVMFGGVVPVSHWFVSHNGFNHPLVQIMLPKIVVMYVITIAGGTFYLSKFPEKFFPGKLNYLGSSHQWWHLMVVLAFAWTHHMTTLVFLYWSSHPCPATLVPPEDRTSWMDTVGLTAPPDLMN